MNLPAYRKHILGAYINRLWKIPKWQTCNPWIARQMHQMQTKPVLTRCQPFSVHKCTSVQDQRSSTAHRSCLPSPQAALGPFWRSVSFHGQLTWVPPATWCYCKVTISVQWEWRGWVCAGHAAPEAYLATGEKGAGVSSLTCGVLIHLTPGGWRKRIPGWERWTGSKEWEWVDKASWVQGEAGGLRANDAFCLTRVWRQAVERDEAESFLKYISINLPRFLRDF